jgi:hypothetical protein
MSRKHWFFDKEHSPKVEINQNITDDVARLVIDFLSCPPSPYDVKRFSTVLTRRRVTLVYDGTTTKKKETLATIPPAETTVRSECARRRVTRRYV